LISSSLGSSRVRWLDNPVHESPSQRKYFVSSGQVTGAAWKGLQSSARHAGRWHLSPIVAIIGRRLLGLRARHRSDTEGRETLRRDEHRRVVIWPAQPAILDEPAGQPITPTRPYKAALMRMRRSDPRSHFSANPPTASGLDISVFSSWSPRPCARSPMASTAITAASSPRPYPEPVATRGRRVAERENRWSVPGEPERGMPGACRPVLKKSSGQRALTTNNANQRQPFSLLRRAFRAFGLVRDTPRTESGV